MADAASLITITYPKGKHGKIARVRTAMRQALSKELYEWDRVTLKRHFMRSAYAEYKYEKRGKRYAARKKKEGYGITPLVRTGGLRDYMMALIPEEKWEGAKTITKTTVEGAGTGAFAVKGIYKGVPKHAFQRPRRKGGGLGPDKQKEIKTVTDPEASAMSKRIAKFIALVEKRG